MRHKIWKVGGMITATFHLPSQSISPFKHPHWIPSSIKVPPLLQHLRGEWVCVPFGSTRHISKLNEQFLPKNEKKEEGNLMSEHHGIAAHSIDGWKLVSRTNSSITIVFIFPPSLPIERIERCIEGKGGTLFFDLKVVSRVDVSLPLGVHPTLSVSSSPLSTVILPGEFDGGLTFPGEFETTTILKPNADFRDLREVPLEKGGVIDLSRLPLVQKTENLVQVRHFCSRLF